MSEDSYTVKRKIPRTALVAAAEIVDRAGGTRVNMRVSEISARGCYVDTLNPFQIGAQVNVCISHNGQTCDAPGKSHLLPRRVRDGDCVHRSCRRTARRARWLAQRTGRPTELTYPIHLIDAFLV